MQKKLTLAVSALVIGGFLGACQTPMQMPWQKSSAPPPVELLDEPAPAPEPAPVAPVPEGLSLSPQQRFKDVPLPNGLKEDFERSYVYESSTLQIGRMVYTSKANVNELANFYLKEAPTAQWVLDNATQAEGSQTLIFKKPGKRLQIVVQKQGVPRPTLLIINFHPEQDSGM